MKLPLNPRLDQLAKGDWDRLMLNLQDLISRANDQVNRLSEGQLSAVHNAHTAAPTTGTYSQGDFLRNAQPTESGGAGSKYVIIGWVCTVGGTPGTWLESRVLTGN